MANPNGRYTRRGKSGWRKKIVKREEGLTTVRVIVGAGVWRESGQELGCFLPNLSPWVVPSRRQTPGLLPRDRAVFFRALKIYLHSIFSVKAMSCRREKNRPSHHRESASDGMRAARDIRHA